MASQEHIEMLRRGVTAWNAWRQMNQEIEPDLSGADLQGMNLRGGHFRHVNFRSAKLSFADFSRSDDIASNQSSDKDTFGYIDKDTYLLKAGDYWEDSIKIALGHTDLRDANLENAQLNDSKLRDAILTHTVFSRANLHNADLSAGILGYTEFNNTDLSNGNLKGLTFRGPCSVDVFTLRKSSSILVGEQETQTEGVAFLRGCGLSDWEIEAARLHWPELSNEEVNDILYKIYSLRAYQAIQINPLFISYNHSDGDFIDTLEYHLNKKGIRFWRDVHHATAGRLEKQVDRAIRLNPTVLVVLSHNSVSSDWVQHEVRLARKLEIETGRDVLCPIALDGSWKLCKWPERLREQIMEYNILDFSSWEDPSCLEHMFVKLIAGLDLFYR